MHRRRFLSAAAAALAAHVLPARAQGVRAAPAGSLGLDAAGLGVRPGTDDATPALQAALDRAAAAGRALFLPPGRYPVSGLAWPNGGRLMGAPGLTRLVAARPGPIFTARGPERIVIEGVVLDGRGLALGQGAALASIEGVRRLGLQDCEILDAGGHGLLLTRSGGTVRDCVIAGARDTGLHALDSTGLGILDNRIERCGNNGVQVWRSAPGDDGTIVRGNRIQGIRADRGGSGEHGNGVNVFRAGGVLVEGNVVRVCAYSAVRNNGSANVAITGNNCAGLSETAIFVEFAHEGCVVAGNVVDGALDGISVTNFMEHRGRLATVSGNVVRNLIRRAHPGTGEPSGGVGIHAEADVSITGNAVDRVAHAGLSLGWGPALRDVIAAGNVVREAERGIIVSLAPGAGRASITGNLISGARRGAIVGMAWDKAVTGDLAREGAAAWPNLVLANNLVS